MCIRDSLGLARLQKRFPQVDILKKLCDEQCIPAKYYTFTEDVPLNLGERTIRALSLIHIF